MRGRELRQFDSTLYSVLFGAVGLSRSIVLFCEFKKMRSMDDRRDHARRTGYRKSPSFGASAAKASKA